MHIFKNSVYLCLAISLSAPSHAQTYDIIDLGANVRPQAINASGVITGRLQTPTGFGRAFIYQNGSLTTFDAVGAYSNSAGLDINDAGDIVGLLEERSLPTRAFVYSADNGIRDLGSLGGNVATASGINNQGQIVGISFLRVAQDRTPFIFENNAMSPLPLLEVRDINNAGAITSAVTSGAVIYKDGLFTHIGTLFGVYALINDINEAGDVVGLSDGYAPL